MDYYKKIIAEAPNYLNNGGKLYFEIGYNQADAVKSLMGALAFIKPDTREYIKYEKKTIFLHLFSL